GWGKSNGPYAGVPFDNNPLNANSAAGSKNDRRPLLELQITDVNLPTPSIETSPVIDSLNHMVYVFYTNAVYGINYSKTTAFADASTTSKYTFFQSTTRGINNGTTYDSKKYCVANYSVPAMTWDGKSIYVIDRYPSPSNLAAPTSFVYSFSKINLPLLPTAGGWWGGGNGQLVNSAPQWNTATLNPAADCLVLDPNVTKGNVFFGMGDGKIYQYDN
ncbi:MAG TPA: hypothetical protein V6D47_07795, partial [Oscillatoriaceae cyanobacterium]